MPKPEFTLRLNKTHLMVSPMGMGSSLKLSENLALLMRTRGITLSQTAKKTAISKATLHNYCQGEIPKHISALIRLAEFFEISLDELVFGADKKRAKKRKSEIVGQYILSIEPMTKEDEDLDDER